MIILKKIKNWPARGSIFERSRIVTAGRYSVVITRTGLHERIIILNNTGNEWIQFQMIDLMEKYEPELGLKLSTRHKNRS